MTTGRWRRARPWAVTVVVGVLACGGAFAVGQRVRSPWEDARSNAETTVLASAVVLRGSLAAQPDTVSATVSAGAVHEVAVPAELPSGLTAVVTSQRVEVGSTVGSGTVLAEIADRPLIALALPFPLFRDLHLGDTGNDVAAVQQALGDLGLDPGRADGVLGVATQAAIGRLYARSGRPVPAPSEEDQAAVVTAQDALDALVAQAVPGDPEPPGSAAARTALAAARARAAGWLPAIEIVAVAGASTVAAVAGVGTVLDAETAVVSLRSGAPTATGRASLAVSESFAVGERVTVAAVGDGGTVSGVVTAVGEFQEGSGDVAPGYDVVVALDDGDALPDGAQVVLAPAAADDPVEGLVVPLAAVRDDGGLAVLVLETDPHEQPARTRRVAVEVVVSADGQAVVQADLAPGDRVVVGP